MVDEAALLQALDRGHLGGVALDVFETEPLPEDSPLWAYERVLVTPHNAYASDRVADRLHALVLRNLQGLRRPEERVMSETRPRFALISPKNRTVYNFRGELVTQLASRGFDPVVTGPNRLDVDRIEALGARFHEIPLLKDRISARADMAYLWRLWRFFRRERPEVALAYTVKPVVYGAIAARLARVPRVVVMITGAGYVFSAQTRKAVLLRRIVGMLYRVAFACADVVIFQNPDDRDQFVGAGLVALDKTRLVNGSGVDVTTFSPAPLPATTTFFMLARILRSKGVEEYLAAARRVKREFPECRFVLLGALEGQADSLGSDFLAPYVDEGTVEYFGETDDVAAYYAQCSVFVLPSYREGTPRTVLEAMAMGRPVITTDAPGCRQTVEHGVNGFLVPVRDADALADRMSWFLHNPDAVTSMGAESRRICLERFDVVQVNREMIKHLGVDDHRPFGRR